MIVKWQRENERPELARYFCYTWWSQCSRSMRKWDSGSSGRFTSYWLCDFYALVLTGNKLPCDSLWSAESRGTFIMYSPQGKSSRSEKDPGLRFEVRLLPQHRSRERAHPFSLCTLIAPLSFPFLLHRFSCLSSRLHRCLSSCLIPVPSSPRSSSSSSSFLYIPTPTRLLWFLFADRPESEKGPPDTLDQWWW